MEIQIFIRWQEKKETASKSTYLKPKLAKREFQIPTMKASVLTMTATRLKEVIQKTVKS